MYGIVEIGGHQYKAECGSLIDVEKIEAEVGQSVELDRVLFIGGDDQKIGLPHVSGAKIQARVVKQDRSRKLLVFKRSPGKWQKRRGHRQHYTALLVTEINDGAGNVKTIDPESAVAKKFLSK